MKVINLIQQDLYRYQASISFKSFLLCYIKDHGFRFTVYHRLYNNSRFFFLIARWGLYKIRLKYGIEIGRNVVIGSGLHLEHPFNITVNSKSFIGCNVTLYKGATIGSQMRGNKKGSPTILNNVYIGINAVIVGRITIGNDVLIAPNAYVNFDVPDHSIVIGNPAFIINKDNATKGYIRNVMNEDVV